MKKLRNIINLPQSIRYLLVFFLLIFSLISIVNHYLYRTYALDLGVYTNALFDYSHFQFNDSTTFKEVPENLLADHFDLYLIILAPLSLIFKTYTLLLAQIMAVLIGGLGIFRYFEAISSRNISLLATLYFFLFFGIYSALSFDYHSNVIATMIIPWFLFFLKKENLKAATICFILILIGKENMSLWMFFISLGLLFEYRKNKRISKALYIFTGFSFVYFIAVTEFVMPAFSNNGSYPHFHYSTLGTSSFEAVQFLFSNPFQAFELFFTNHLGNSEYDFIKLELFVLLIISGLPILFLKPHYLFMLLPVFCQKLFHDNPSMWGIYSQYSVEFAPIFTIGIFVVISQIKNVNLKKRALIFLPLLAIFSTIRLMDNTVTHTNKNKIRIYQAKHYKRNYSLQKVTQKLNEIPKNAIVSAQSPFLAQLAYRDNIYQFPIVKNAEYIVFSTNEVPFPLDEESFEHIVEDLLNQKLWEVYCEFEGFKILKKN